MRIPERLETERLACEPYPEHVDELLPLLLHPRVVEVGWIIAPDRWGRGLATELAHASVGAAFAIPEVPDVIAYALPHNLASRRVMEKTDLRYERDFEHEDTTHVLYRRSRC